MKTRRQPELKPREGLPRRDSESKTSKDKKKRKRDKLSFERRKTSNEELTTFILKNKNLKSKEFKCKRLFTRSATKSARFKLQSTTLPTPATESTTE